MENVELISCKDEGALARAAAAAWLDEVAAANQRGAAHYVALSGGRSARSFFASTANLARAREVSLGAVHFFWADERCVPPTDVESNYRMAQEFLFSPLSIQSNRIHRVRGEQPPDSAAARAEAEIRSIAPINADGQPVLDLVLLGMGEDGHVASLFPGEPEVVRSNKAVYRAVTDSPKPPPNRVTIGYATIAAAKQVWVLVSSSGKAAALRESLEPSGQTPLARVVQSRSQTRLFSDQIV